jgi:hypothetical protein|tara:strand:+ start:173 stop:892 length:720 start_codon:yes stop_codon:yes gene_type:complete
MPTALNNFTDALAFGALNDVLSIFRSDNAYGRPNLYEVQIFPPNHLGGGNSELNPKDRAELGHNTREISLRADSLILPGRGLTTQQLSGGAQYGPMRELVTEATYAEDITMSFQASNGLDERTFFENWQEQAFNVLTHDVGYYYNYVGTIDIFLLNRDFRKAYGLRLHECFPKTIGGTNLAAGPSSEIIKTPVSWAFRNWTNIGGEPPKSLADRLFDTALGTVERSITANLPATLRRLF